MVEFKSLKVWNHDRKEFEIKDLNFEVNENISFTSVKLTLPQIYLIVIFHIATLSGVRFVNSH